MPGFGGFASGPPYSDPALRRRSSFVTEAEPGVGIQSAEAGAAEERRPVVDSAVLRQLVRAAERLYSAKIAAEEQLAFAGQAGGQDSLLRLQAGRRAMGLLPLAAQQLVTGALDLLKLRRARVLAVVQALAWKDLQPHQ